MAANMVVLGFLSEALGIIKREDLLEVVKENVAERFVVELNFKAVDAGIAYAKEHNLYADKVKAEKGEDYGFI